ncbi:carcinoembryonic antigen-related cell adhesion molecule 7-like isoform X1 [Heterodontus francisci]|uniref:carcinoembryonic antigen-related cell adhesion molecule 7-like isoform X1 n=1 Tax=Heterodontus francisci TaxID=7792 RepID=UPI00355B606F
MERTRLTALAVWLFLSAVESQPLTILVDESLINAAVGQPVLLSVRPSVRVRSGNWKHNGTDVGVWIITNPDINNVYTGRVELLFPNASLLLKSVSVSDSGVYIVIMNSFSNTAATARMDLFVFEPISSVYITSTGSNPVRENDTVWLTCNVLGNYNQRIWSFNGTDVESNERIIFSSENATLMILGVNARNSGEYQCIARNPVSEKASEPYFLHISRSDQSFVETCNSNKWEAAVAVLGVISVTALITVGVLVLKLQKIAQKEMSESYTLATVCGGLSQMPTYESFMPSVNDERECRNQDQSDSNYMILLTMDKIYQSQSQLNVPASMQT